MLSRVGASGSRSFTTIEDGASLAEIAGDGLDSLDSRKYDNRPDILDAEDCQTMPEEVPE
jgi:hypothetical protein